MRNLLKEVETVVQKNTGYTLLDLEACKTKKYEIDNIEKAANMIMDAVNSETPITIVGDYDADGICATAIFKVALRKLGADVKTRLPHRFSEGYGLSPKIVDEIDEGLLITVDNGIAAKEAIQKAKDKGLTVLITDHHLAPNTGIPDMADLIIDPNAIPNSATFNGYCGAGLAMKISSLLFDKKDKVQDKFLTLAAIATVADSVPLIEDNRNIVKLGLEKMTNKDSVTTGLRALIEEVRLQDHITEKDIGFKIGPCLNAAGRLYDDGAERALKLVSFNGDKKDAKILAEILTEYNETRKELTDVALETFNKQIVDNALYGYGTLILQSNDVGEGLVGLVAGKMTEQEKRPCFVFGPFENGICKGSGRTFGGVHLKNLLDEINDLVPGALVRYGGHAAAAGVSVAEDKWNEFYEAITNYPIDIVDEDLVPDIEICENEIEDAVAALRPFAPFGQENPQVIFKINAFQAMPAYGKMVQTLKDKHLKFVGQNSEAIWFSAIEQYNELDCPNKFDIVGVIGENYFNGHSTPSIEISTLTPIVENHETPFAELLRKKALARK